MTIIGLDTLGLLLLVVALAVMLTYMLYYGWNIEFTKKQFTFVVLVLILFGMFIMAWLRETGDELLIGMALFAVALLLVAKRIMAGRKRRRTLHGG